MAKDSQVTYVAMVGDLLHQGHLNILHSAHALGLPVVVGVLTDAACQSYKRLPVVPYKERAAIIQELRMVARVIPQTTLSYETNLRLLKPRYVVHGDDWCDPASPQRLVRREVVNTLGEWMGQLVEVHYTPDVSTTLRLQQYVDAELKVRGGV